MKTIKRTIFPLSILMLAIAFFCGSLLPIEGADLDRGGIKSISVERTSPDMVKDPYAGSRLVTPYKGEWREDPLITPFVMAKDEYKRFLDDSPLDLRGCVIDQDGNGLPGVKMTFSAWRNVLLNGGVFAYGNFVFSAYTEPDGSFHLSGFNVDYINLIDLEKEGYTRRFFYDQNDSPIKPDLEGKFSNPFTFYMWKRLGDEKLLCFKGGNRLPLEGVPYQVEMLGETLNSGRKRENFGNLQFVVYRNDAQIESGAAQYDWEITITALDGGILLADSPMPYLAPESGYQKEIKIAMKKDDADWKPGKKISCYIVSGSPMRYSRWLFDFDFHGDVSYRRKDGKLTQKCQMNYRFFMNPTGSRLLEPNPPTQRSRIGGS